MAKKKPVTKTKAKPKKLAKGQSSSGQKKTVKVVRVAKASKPTPLRPSGSGRVSLTHSSSKQTLKHSAKVKRVKKAAPKAKAILPKQKPNFFSQINLSESYTSLILGAVVVILVVIIAFLLIKPAREGSVSSTRTDVMTEERAREKKEKMSSPSATVAPQEQVGEKITGKTYTVQEGDSISDIAQRAYNDEEKWVVIAEANNLSSPDAIAAGMVLTIPR